MDELSTAALGILDEVFGEIQAVFYTASVDREFNLSYVSSNIGRVLGVPPEACIGPVDFWRERIHAEDAVQVLQELAGLAAAGCRTQEFRFRDGQGRYRWVSNDVACKCDAGGAPVCLAGCLRDISAVKNREAEFDNNLRERDAREHFYRSVLDSVPQRMFWKDRNSVFRGCNLSGARALELPSADDISGKTDYDFYPNRDEANYLRLQDEQVMNSGQPSYHAEAHGREANIWLDVTKVPLRNEMGETYGLLVSYEDVSALKKSEMALHKFKRAVEQSSNSIFITDVAGNIEYVNPAFLSTYGYAEHEVLGKNPRLLKSGLITQEFYRDMWQTILSGQSWRGELSNRSKDGVVSWQLTSISPILDEVGKISHFLAIEDDVTKRRCTEEALAESEARLREITGTVGEGIYVVDTDGTITFVNPAAEKLLGWSANNLLGTDVRNTFNCPMHGYQSENDAPTSEKQASRWMDRIKHQRKAMRSESQFFRRKDGSRFQVSIIATPILRDGHYAGAVVAFHDITEQKLTQKLLSDTLQELNTVLDNVQIGVAYLREGKFLWVNRHMGLMFGYPADSLQGQRMDSIYSGNSREMDDFAGELTRLLGNGEVYENELMMKRCSGEAFWCHQRGIAIDPGNPAKGSIWIMLDIDRLKNTEDSLRALNGTLAQRVNEETQKTLEKERLLIQQGRSAAMGEMIGNIAHQWRQPLSTLGLILQNLYADYQENALNGGSLDKYVETAMLSIQRMSSTIDDFRDFFRPNRVKVCYSIYQAINEAIRLLDAMLKNNGITVLFAGEPGLKAIGHPNELSQVILNFISNAKEELVDRKIPQGRITIELAEQGEWGVVTIGDNAGGIKNDDLERIFDPYFTTKQNGSGIGLYMNKTIVEKHMGGRITCRNTREGAEFTIAIPLEQLA